MFSKKILLGTIVGLLTIASFASTATPVQIASNDVVAREATEAPRGADNNNHRQRRGGRLINDTGVDILARRGADDPPGTEAPGEVHGQGRGGRLSDDAGAFIIARRGADDPPGTEAPGEVHGQGRGGRLSDEAGSFIIAREATEAPRGADNNNQRRRGRNG